MTCSWTSQAAQSLLSSCSDDSFRRCADLRGFAFDHRVDTRWGILALVAAVTLFGLGGVILIARFVGARYSDALCSVMPRVAWVLSYPLRPALLIHDALLNRTAPESESSLDIALSVDTDSNPLDEHEVRMIRGVVQLDQTVAREIMTPGWTSRLRRPGTRWKLLPRR